MGLGQPLVRTHMVAMAASSFAAPWILRRAFQTFSLSQPLLHINPGSCFHGTHRPLTFTASLTHSGDCLSISFLFLMRMLTIFLLFALFLCNLIYTLSLIFQTCGILCVS